MLDKDPAKRPSASEVLRNEYIAQNLAVRNYLYLNNAQFTPNHFIFLFHPYSLVASSFFTVILIIVVIMQTILLLVIAQQLYVLTGQIIARCV